MKILYAITGGTAIAFALWLTGYGAALNLEHYQDLLRWIGPTVSVGACLALCYADIGWRAGKVKAAVIGAIGLIAALVSGTVILDRVAGQQQASLQATRDSNLPRELAKLALTRAESEVAAAAANTRTACSRPKAITACKSAKDLEAAARARQTEANAKVVAAGAKSDVDPGAATIATVFSISPELYRRVLPLCCRLGLRWQRRPSGSWGSTSCGWRSRSRLRLRPSLATGSARNRSATQARNPFATYARERRKRTPRARYARILVATLEPRPTRPCIPGARR